MRLTGSAPDWVGHVFVAADVFKSETTYVLLVVASAYMASPTTGWVRCLDMESGLVTDAHAVDFLVRLT